LCGFQNIFSISGPNIALGRKANQGPDTYQSCSADKAVDGDTSNTAGNYAHTTVGSPAWWRVDLGKRFLVTGLKLFNRARGRTYLRIFIFIIHLVYVWYASFIHQTYAILLIFILSILFKLLTILWRHTMPDWRKKQL